MNLNKDNTAYFISLFCLIGFMGLFYQVAWQYPVNDYFPLIERLLDPEFLTNDFYTNTFEEYSPRRPIAGVIAWLSNLLNMEYTHVIGYLNIFRIWIYAIGLYFLFCALVDKKTALVALSFSALSFLSMPFLPAWWPISYDLTGSNVALVFAMFAWVFSAKGNVKTCIALLTLTVYIHPVVGIQALLISLIIYFFIFGIHSVIDNFRDPWLYLISAIFLGVFALTYLSYQQVLTDELFIDINAKFRHAHHFEFQHMPLDKWISTILMSFICLVIAIAYNKTHIEKDKISIPIIGYSVLMVLIGLFFAQTYPSRMVISFIPMRAFPILVPIITLAFARLAMTNYNKGNLLGFYALFLPFLPYNHLGLTWFLFPDQPEMTLPILMTVLSFLILLVTNKIPNNFANIFLAKISANSMSLLILPIGILSLVLSLFRFEIDIPTLENQANIYQWINKNTPTDAIVLTELNAANSQKIRLVSKRAVIISKDFPFNELFYEEWYKRYSEIYIHKDAARGHIDSLDSESLNELMDKYQATYLIRTKPLSENPYFELIDESEGEISNALIYKNIHLTPRNSI